MSEEIITSEVKSDTKPNRNRGRGRNQATPKNEEVKPLVVEKDPLANYISNLESNVYAITGLPEEFIATLFAWVSRSPKSFKEHLKEAIAEFELSSGTTDPFAGLSEKAKAFHEKWTVGYGHSCYDEETDVLTKEGFKRWSEVTEDDELASVDPDTLEVEYQKPIRLIKELYVGPMYKVDRNRIDMLVTPNHKLFAWPRHKIGDFATRKYQLIEAQDLKSKCYKVRLGGLKWNGDVSDTMYDYPIQPLLQLYGFFIGDGNIDSRMKHAINFHIKKQRKVKYLYSLCEQLGLTISANKNDKYYITSSDKRSIGDIMSACYDKNKEKQIPEELFDLDSSLLDYLYDGLLNSDGSIGKSGELYDTTSLNLANQIQHLCVLLGWTSSATLLHPASEHGRHKDGWRIFINKKLLESMVNKVQYDIFDEWVDYDGIVYCAELPKYHTLIVRRNGRIHVSGNSVAEHAVAHVGVEGISRLASAELELSNTFLSITEYSQRYQKPKRGNWHNPFEEGSEQYEEVEAFYHKCFNLFEGLIETIWHDLLQENNIEFSQGLWDGVDHEGNPSGGFFIEVKKDDPRYQEAMALKKLAFEDARYVLPLSMHTQLGMTANGRAWRDALSTLGTSGHAESKKLADDLRTEITKVLPVLLKYATPSQYQTNSKKRITNKFDGNRKNKGTSNVSVQLAAVNDESNVIMDLVSLLLMENEGLSYGQAHSKAKALGEEARTQVIKDLLHEMQSFDAAPELFKHVKYQAQLRVSEANWHQLLRHNRKTDFIFSSPSPYNGVTIPKTILKSIVLTDALTSIAVESEELYTKLVEAGYEKEAEYVVLNAHNRQIFMSFDLQEAYHLINLRTSPEAQWDIRNTFDQLHDQLQRVHPTLINKAKRR